MSEQTDINAEELLLRLRRKEGNWVEWGKACQTLQKAGYSTQAIFEATGFEPIQQNQIIVAAQVFDSMMSVGIAPATEAHYSRVGSDSLYELRILSKEDRAAAADFLHSRNIDSDGAREVAKAFKEFSLVNKLPEGFSHHPGDAVAYQYWRYAKQQSDLAEKSRLIARGLMFAHTQSARGQIEKLLTDLAPKSQRPAPSLPVYRLEAEEELPRIFPVAGTFPLSAQAVLNVPQVAPVGHFQWIQTNWQGGWVTLPGWEVLMKAEDPIAVLAHTDNLPIKLQGNAEEAILVFDRAETTWSDLNYFALDRDGKVEIEWSDTQPSATILGKLLLILRPKRLSDDSKSKDIWYIEE
jgi:hypothetical protein